MSSAAPFRRPRLLYWLQVCAAHTRRLADQDLLAHAGLTAAQLGALFVIDRTQGCLLKDLASGLNINGSAVTTLSNRLLKRGLVLRQPCPRDGRASLLSLTDEGRLAIAAAKPRVDAMNDWFSEDFNDAELAVVERFLRSISERDFPSSTAPERSPSAQHPAESDDE